MTIKAREQIAKDDCIRNGGTGIPAKQIGWKDGNDGKDGKDGKKGQSKAENGGKKTYSTSGEEKYTSEEDLLIKKLKEEGTPWKKILTALGKNSESQLRAHWKTLEGKPTAAEAADNAEENAQKLDKQAKAEKNKAEGLKKQAEAQAKKDGKGKKNKGQEKKVCCFLVVVLSRANSPVGGHCCHETQRRLEYWRQRMGRSLRRAEMVCNRCQTFRYHWRPNHSRGGSGYGQRKMRTHTCKHLHVSERGNREMEAGL